MSDYSVELSVDAQNDIISIRDYIRDRLKSISAAEKFLTDTYEDIVPLKTIHTILWLVMTPIM